MGASSGAPTMSAGAGAMPDIMSNANLAQVPQGSFSTGGMGAPEFGAFNSVDMAGSAPSMEMADLSGGNIPNTPMQQSNQGMLKPQEQSFMDKMKGADWKGMSKDLAAASGQNQPKHTTVNTQASGAGGGQLPNYYAAMMGAPQASGAMQAIQGSMPQMQQPMGILGRV
jgi:hypothetical protein